MVTESHCQACRENERLNCRPVFPAILSRAKMLWIYKLYLSSLLNPYILTVMKFTAVLNSLTLTYTHMWFFYCDGDKVRHWEHNDEFRNGLFLEGAPFKEEGGRCNSVRNVLMEPKQQVTSMHIKGHQNNLGNWGALEKSSSRWPETESSLSWIKLKLQCQNHRSQTPYVAQWKPDAQRHWLTHPKYQSYN